MALRLALLDGTTRSAFERLLEHAWEQNWDSALARDLIHWRYYERPAAGSTWLAFVGNDCVALLDTFLRPYLLDGRRVLLRETSDWFCMPKYRPLGLGIKLMRRMMAYPEPLFSIGGTQATLGLLPRLGWASVPDVQSFILLVKARGLAAHLLRYRWPAREALARVIPASIPLWLPRSGLVPPGGVTRVDAWQPGIPTPPPPHCQEGLVQLLVPADRDWIARMPPGLARPVGLIFLLNEAPVGFSLSQLEPWPSGFNACIVHFHTTSEVPQVMTDWIVAETALHLAREGAEVVRCCASSPAKIIALERAGFIKRAPVRSYWWSNEGVPPPALLDVGYLRADDAVPFSALRGRRLGTQSLSLPTCGA